MVSSLSKTSISVRLKILQHRTTPTMSLFLVMFAQSGAASKPFPLSSISYFRDTRWVNSIQLRGHNLNIFGRSGEGVVTVSY